MPTKTQSKITIITTHPTEQENTNQGRDIQHQAQKKYREKTRKIRPPRTNTALEEAAKHAQEQGQQRNAETNNTHDGNNTDTRKDTPEEIEEPH